MNKIWCWLFKHNLVPVFVPMTLKDFTNFSHKTAQVLICTHCGYILEVRSKEEN